MWKDQNNVLCKGINEEIEAKESFNNILKLYNSIDDSFYKMSVKNQLIFLHKNIFKDLHQKNGVIRNVNLSKGNALFCVWYYIDNTFADIDTMYKNIRTKENIIEIYTDLNMTHPFYEGNGRSTRFWLDLTFKKYFNQIVCWDNISKEEYMDAMIQSQSNNCLIKNLILNNLTNDLKIQNLEHNLLQSYQYEGLNVKKDKRKEDYDFEM